MKLRSGIGSGFVAGWLLMAPVVPAQNPPWLPQLPLQRSLEVFERRLGQEDRAGRRVFSNLGALQRALAAQPNRGIDSSGTKEEPKGLRSQAEKMIAAHARANQLDFSVEARDLGSR